MRARLALVLALTLAGASLFLALAGASHRNLKDGNDTRGRLDVRRVKTFGRVTKPGWRVLTFARFTTAEMRDAGFFLVNFDTFGDKRFDYYALISSNGSAMKGTLWRDPNNRPDRRVSKLETWRASSDSVSLRVPLKKMNLGDKKRVTYRWYVKTILTGGQCRRVCFDRAPNRGAINESNGKPKPKPPEPTPTATPTDDPTITESPDDPGVESPPVTESPSVTESPPVPQSP